MSETKTVFRSCNLCEAMCGVQIDVIDGKISSIRGDKNDSFSRGHICPKGTELKNIYEDPDRLKFPIRRNGSTWEQISWEEAFTEVTTTLHNIQTKHGKDAVGYYSGNPNVHNYGSMLFSPRLIKKLKSKNIFSATSVDQLPHHFASLFMFGHPLLLPIPDIDHTKYMLIIGANPSASNGSIMTVPDVKKRLHAIQERGGKYVVIDPRKTETADSADEHIFIRPGTDAFFLLSVLQTIFSEKLIKDVSLFNFVTGIKDLGELVSDFVPEATESLTGISADLTRRIAREFANSESAVCHGRVGLSMQEFGGLSQWLVYALNIVTGNLDRQGGAMFTLPAVDPIGPARMGGTAPEKFDRYRTKARDLPEFDGEFPVAGLADEILYRGEGGIRALITSAGNPVLSTPNGPKLERALESLEYMVCVDFYLNETTKYANIILPPSSGLEHDHYDLIFNVFAVRNTTKYSAPVFEPEEGMLHDWEIFSELTNRLDILQSGKTDVFPNKSKIKPSEFLDRSLRAGPYGESKKMNLELLLENPHGIDLGPLKPVFPERLHTLDKKIHLVPDRMRKDLERLARKKTSLENEIKIEKRHYSLIGRRHLRNNNSWMHNMPKLMTGKSRCTLLLHPSDASTLGVSDKQFVIVRSRVGQVEIEAELSESMMPGVVSIPHGFGHGKLGTRMATANQHAGVSINDLTDEMALDELTGNAAFSGVPVSVEGI